MAVIDTGELNAIMDNDSGLIAECFSEFLEDYPAMIQDLQAAVAQGHCEAIDLWAHKLKGSLTYLAAKDAARAARTVETAGRQKDLEKIHAQMADLQAACQKVVHYIQDYLA